MAFPTFSLSTTAEEVATAFAEQIAGKNGAVLDKVQNLISRPVLITGTSLNGIGFEAVRVIAKHANLVIITGYSVKRLKISEDAIKKEMPSANIRGLQLDLSSLAAVRVAAAEVNAYPEPLHVLIDNAAAVVGPFKLTVDGLESQMAINHVGHFLLTALLAPKLLASKTASHTPRVVFVSSAAHTWCDGVDLAAIEHPSAEAYDAGAICTNIQFKEESRAYMQFVGFVHAEGNPTNDARSALKTIPQGAATTVAAAFDPRLEDKSGSYLADCVEANDAVAPHSADPGMAQKLWALTEKIVGEKFVFH
ncbi:hypothetical protein DFH06DRAFT_1317462 [Mycena polygramma]|nr:hypothetical protein DFH06DRAFT_1317462 [Mycena polygramma]